MEQTDRIADLLRDVLGQKVVGAYFHGSAVLGGLRPHSDIDVLVVSKQESTLEERRILIDRLLSISGPGDPSGRSRSIELTIVVESAIRPWRYPPRCDFQYGEWWRREFERGDPAPWPPQNPDLALLVTVALSGNRPLFGPPPAQTMDPAPRRDLVRSTVDCIPGLLCDLEWDTRNVVLTFARIWKTVATGMIHSKEEAADWVLARLPAEHRPVPARARSIYAGSEADRWEDLMPRVRPYVDHVIREIEAAGDGSRAQ